MVCLIEGLKSNVSMPRVLVMDVASDLTVPGFPFTAL
jgi:hypothetical protein